MVYLIYGSPCSGKSTYIKKHMTNKDIVCDVDLIYDAISNHNSHDADLYIHDTAIQVTNQLMDIIKNRQGMWNDAYVVSTANTREQLKIDKEKVNADECIFIDTPIETCLERIKDRPPYFKYLILEWFSTSDL